MSIDRKKYQRYIGIDEVGRGPLAGPVTLGFFMIEHNKRKEVHQRLAGITDSKKLSPKKRREYSSIINTLQTEGLVVAITRSVSATLIDKIGINRAIELALKRGIKSLDLDASNDMIILDGGLYAPKQYHQETIIKGDQSNWLIGAASVFAKVARDNKMDRYAKKYPHYCFDQNKGYGTEQHRKSIQKYGPSDLHRKSWIH